MTKLKYNPWSADTPILIRKRRFRWQPPMFTVAPHIHRFLDRTGRIYWFDFTPYPEDGLIYNPSVWYEDVRFKGLVRYYARVGEVQLLWYLPETLELCDIVLHGQHRGSGLGTALLNAVIAFAEQKGVKHIEGFMQPEEHRDMDRLVAFYRQAGFDIDGVNLWLDLPRS